MADTPYDIAKELIKRHYENADRFTRIKMYIDGDHDKPFIPDGVDEEYKLIIERSITNWMPLLMNSISQCLYVDGFRPGRETDDILTTPEWQHFEQSGLAARQIAVHRAAAGYGHSFTRTERVGKKVITRGMSPRRTEALFEDPANDIEPYAVMEFNRWATSSTPGTATMWFNGQEFRVDYEHAHKDNPKVEATGRYEVMPVTRFAAQVDLDGCTLGVVEPHIAAQNRINQTVFDLLMAQSFSSIQVRTATGMHPGYKRDENGDYLLDPETGQKIPSEVQISQKRMLMAKDPNAKFGVLPGQPLDGFISAVDSSIRSLAANSQTPPHYLLGQIANLSAEALRSAESSLMRKLDEFKCSFGESWERVFRVAGQLAGQEGAATDFSGEVIWRKVDPGSQAANADALGKLADMGVPAIGLLDKVDGATPGQVQKWRELMENDPGDGPTQLANEMRRGSSSRLPEGRVA